MPEQIPDTTRGLTFRSFVICLVSLFLMGAWVEYEERFNKDGGPLGENMPPNCAVGLILFILLLGGLLYRFRKGMRLRAAELVVIYTALVLAAPLMTQGLWGRMSGLLCAIPHSQNFKAYDNLPAMLWPHGENLIPADDLRDSSQVYRMEGDGSVEWETLAQPGDAPSRIRVLKNSPSDAAKTSVAVTLNRYNAAGREVLVPGERFLFSVRIRTEGFQKGSFCYVTMQADQGSERTLITQATSTRPTFSSPAGFQRIGVCPVTIPSDLRQTLSLRVGLSGVGSLAVNDLEFMNVEAVEGLYSGRKLVHEHDLAALGPNERDATVVRPDRLLSIRGLKYLFTGFIPLAQWLQPALAWAALVGALFMGFLGFNLLMRKQWAEHERFAFPLTIIPRHLFTESTDEQGRVYRPIFSNRIMWIGFGITFFLAMLKGLNFYFPSVPAPVFQSTSFSAYVTNPLAKAFLDNIGVGVSLSIGLPLCVIAVALLIENQILFSLWFGFLVFQLWYLFGAGFNLHRFPGYPWRQQQSMGAFLMYALTAVIVARRHLWRVFNLVVGRLSGDAGSADSSDSARTYRVAVLLCVGSLASLAAWGVWTQMGVWVSLLFFGYMLVIGFAASKIRAECGAPFAYLTPYVGMQFVGAMGGFAVFGSKGMLVATLASGFMTTASFLLMAPVQVEMMELGRHFKVRLRDVSAGLVLGLLGGLFAGGFGILCWAYGFGANNFETSWPYHQEWFINLFSAGEAVMDRACEAGTLATAAPGPMDLLNNADARGLTIGALITMVLSFIRARFVWFPLHPLGYALAPSYFMQGCFVAIFIAWVVRVIVLKLGGAQTIRRVLVPFRIGMLLACVASVVVFDVVGLCLRAGGATRVYSGIP